MSKQLDDLRAAQSQTAKAIADLQAAVAQPKPDDLSDAITAEQNNAAAVAAVTAFIAPPAPAPAP